MECVSEPHLFRRDSIPRPMVRVPHAPRKVSAVREKRSTDNDFMTERDVMINQENSSQRATLVEVICTTTTKCKKATLNVLDHETTTLNFPRAGAINYTHTFKPRLKKSDGGGPLSVSSSILNVDLVDVATHSKLSTTTTAHFIVLDGLFRWDMENVPTETSLNATHFPFAHIDDDNFFANDIPFPLNRHSNVVLENMGVKKSKTLAKARSGGTNLLNRQALFPRVVDPLPLPNQSEGCLLPCLPDPLPLRTLCPNTGVPRREQIPNLSATRRDSNGITHLGSADCDLSILFPQSSHFEVWDMGDDALIAVPATLSISAKHSSPWTGVPISVPDVSLIEIRCEDSPFPSLISKYDPSQEYTTVYSGSKTGTVNDDLDSVNGSPRSNNKAKNEGISLKGRWMRVYNVRKRGSTENELVDAPRWDLQIWIPIPTRLFEKRETRAFTISARIWMMGDEMRAVSLDENVNGQVIPLFADAEMTISHLRKEREMEGSVFS